MQVLQGVSVAWTMIVFSAASSASAPKLLEGQPSNDAAFGRWIIEFRNGVVEECEIRQDGSATVVEPLRASPGRVELGARSVVIRYDDDRVERCTPLGRRMIVEHWFPASAFPAGKAVLGVARRAK
jgi:hypothetical protein